MSIQNDLQTIRDFIRYAASRFNASQIYFGHGTDNAWDEAIALILHELHIPYQLLAGVMDAKLTTEEKTHLLNLIDTRIEKRIPVPYLTHEAWFAGLAFYVDERVLIPRSPIAELIENGFQPWRDPEDIHSILDLCTGSGCIAIACAKTFPDAEIVASDISAEALAVAKINCLRHHVEDQVELVQSDLFKSMPAKRFDLIVSNPPYVSQEEMDELPEEYRHEPVHGLHSGTHGLDATLEILRTAKDFLTENGALIVEVGNSEFALSELHPDFPFTWIEFERGGGGVFMVTASELKELQ